MSDETRVVLVKPGDVLLLGNVRLSSYEHGAEVMKRFKELTGITSVVVFADDIQLDLLTGAQLSDLAKRAGTADIRQQLAGLAEYMIGFDNPHGDLGHHPIVATAGRELLRLIADGTDTCATKETT